MLWLAVFVAGLCPQVASTSTFRECYTVDDNKHCFKTEPGKRETWADAKKSCETRFGRSYTLLVNDRHIHNALVQFMDLADIIESQVSYIWTGVTRTTQDKWFWIDETQYTGKLVAVNKSRMTFY